AGVSIPWRVRDVRAAGVARTAARNLAPRRRHRAAQSARLALPMLAGARRRSRPPRRQLVCLRRRRGRAVGPARVQADRGAPLSFPVVDRAVQRVRAPVPPRSAAARRGIAAADVHRILRDGIADNGRNRRSVIALRDAGGHDRLARGESAARDRATIQADVDALARVRRQLRRRRAAERPPRAAGGGAAVTALAVRRSPLADRRLTLIRPNLGDYRSSDAMPPLAMGILAARAAGWQVRFYDEKAEAVPLDLDTDLV